MIPRSSRLVLTIVLGVLALLLAAAGLTQTSLFKQTLRSTLYKLVESNLNASVYIGEIRGNLLTGFSVDTLAMYVNNASFVEAGNVSLRYKLLPLWSKHISIESAEIDRPSVSLIRFSDGVWNIARLAKKKPERDTLPSPWLVTVNTLRITNATFRLIDSTLQSVAARSDTLSRSAFNYSDLDLQKVNIDLKGSMSADEQNVSVKSLSFASPREGFSLSKFRARIRHTQSESEIKDLLIVTPRSHVELSLNLGSINAFKIKDLTELQHATLECAVGPSAVAADELRRFLPSLSFLRGVVHLEGNLGGEFGLIRVNNLQAAFSRSTINLSGTVSNLHRPEELTLNIESKGSVIHPSDVPKLMPLFHMPDYGNAGNLVLDLHYAGKPLDFRATGRISSSAGNVFVDGRMDLSGDVMRYRATIDGRGLNLQRIFSNPALRSHLNFSGTVEGRGFSLGELNSTMSLHVDSSSLMQIPITHLRVTAGAASKSLSFSAVLQSPKGNISVESEFKNMTDESSSFAVKGTFDQVDLAPVLGDERYSSACSFTLTGDGRDFLSEHMTGHLQMEFSPSHFGVHSFDSARVELEVHPDSLGGKSLRFVSPVADASIDGIFSYRGVLAAVSSSVDGLLSVYRRQRAMFDSSFVTPEGIVDEGEEPTGRIAQPPKNEIHYSVRLKNLEPLSIFLGSPGFNAIGQIDGSLWGNQNTLSADGLLSIQSGKYQLTDGLLLIEKGTVSYKLDNMTRDSLLAVVNGPTIDLHVAAENLLVGQSYVHTPALDLSYRNRRAEYSLKGGLDSTIILGVDGRAYVSPELVHFTFDNFSFRYQGYELNNTKQFSARMTNAGFSVDSTTFTHQDEQLTIGGTINYHGRIGGFAGLQNFALSNIHHFGKSVDFKSSALAFGGTVNTSVSVGGTTDEPILTGKLMVTNFAFRGTEFGNVDGAVHYAAKAADFAVQLSRANQPPGSYELLGTGTVPMDLSFGSVANRFSLSGMDMYLKAQDFDISIIDPFIAQVEEMKGTLDGSIHCTGSLESPSFSGGTELRKAEFMFPLNSMKYQMAGSVALRDNRLSLENFSVKNLYEDYSAGAVAVGGYITLRGFVPDEYHLNAKGELMVLQSTSRNVNQGVYGDLIASTRDDSLFFDGTYPSSRFSGALFVKQASLTFPSTRQAPNQISFRNINIVVVDDTSKPVQDTLLGPNLFALFRPQSAAADSRTPSFLDGLGYDLVIQTDGVVQIRMVFNPSTNEELFADLNGKLNLSKEGSNVRLTGTITVSEKSNYKFYKQFDAAGTLKFTGRPDNPQLEIKATYMGTHIKSEAGPQKPQEPTQKEAAPSPPEKVVISLAITGTRLDPKIKIGLATIDENGNEKERAGDVESDAISFLLTSTPGISGKFRDDLTSNDKQGIANSLGGSISGSLISGFTNTLLSGMMLDFLRSNNINAVSNVELTYSGASPDLRLSGVIGNAYWTFGGKVFNDINNANISLQWSLGSIIQNERMRNFMFEVNRKTDPLETSDLRRPTSGARIYYKFAF